jgi:sodium transport system permease protein
VTGSELRAARAVYVKELRHLLRDRHILVYSLALPAFLYPAVVLGILEVAAYVRGVEERRVSRVELIDTVTQGELARLLNEKDRGIAVAVAAAPTQELELEAVRDRLREGREGKGEPPADAVLVLQSAPREEASASAPVQGTAPARVAAQLYFTAARSASVQARQRVERALGDYRKAVLAGLVKDAGEGESLLEVLEVEEVKLSTPREFANHVLALVLPLVMIFMTALGAFYPALDATVGEKERGTLETTLLAPVARRVTVAGKYAAVTTISFTSFFVNFAGMYLTFSHLQTSVSMARAGFSAPAIAVVLAGALLLAAFFSAAMMLVAFLARSFKEGQTYATPIYLVSLAPVVVLADPEARLTLPLSFVPVVNLSLLFRDALEGRLVVVPATVALLGSAALAGASLWLASGVLGRESVATGGELRALETLRRALAGRRRGEEGA